jgi:hypothetical protein
VYSRLFEGFDDDGTGALSIVLTTHSPTSPVSPRSGRSFC